MLLSDLLTVLVSWRRSNVCFTYRIRFNVQVERIRCSWNSTIWRSFWTECPMDRETNFDDLFYNIPDDILAELSEILEEWVNWHLSELVQQRRSAASKWTKRRSPNTATEEKQFPFWDSFDPGSTESSQNDDLGRGLSLSALVRNEPQDLFNIDELRMSQLIKVLYSLWSWLSSLLTSDQADADFAADFQIPSIPVPEIQFDMAKTAPLKVIIHSFSLFITLN